MIKNAFLILLGILLVASLAYSVYSFVSLQEAAVVAELRQVTIDSIRRENVDLRERMIERDSIVADSLAKNAEAREEAERVAIRADTAYRAYRERVRGMVNDTVNALLDSMTQAHEHALTNKDIIIASFEADTLLLRVQIYDRDAVIRGLENELSETRAQVNDLKQLNRKDFLSFSLDWGERGLAVYGAFKAIDALASGEGLF